ncbi:MAG: glycosyltransferase family 9 protein [Candidatus Woesearchaeota archaeon]|nr:glycosyltransferase family 9 protein [Candidatus Woesearchaeota archaeon]MDP7181025.1 glycosyltransferase family 9 protein [Candidatus Woesearchaeota archaeon]MDP7198354.1 glycosyltransferase family 9 protein [Candidatus Woesearchaeota archaeon]MDP7467456.1 glycosyltransferase family 9 protein [Candidatus Woesearchaeota archaeon]MDP7647683.1 glycosyltransferase family 9 protein [Candidatus Woesearchaeota archaeon]
MKLQRAIDRYVGAALILLLWPLKLFSRKIQNKEAVFIKLWAIGESVLTLPALKALHDRGWNVTVLCTKRNASVYQQPFIKKVLLMERFLTIERKFQKFDVAIDGEPYLNLSALFTRWMGKHCIGFAHGSRARLYNERVPYKDMQHVVRTYGDLMKPLQVELQAQTLIPLPGAKRKKLKVIGLAPGVAESGKSRVWPAAKWAVLADTLIKQGNKVCFVGNQADVASVQRIQKLMKEKAQSMAGKTSLTEFFSWVTQCKAFVGCDSGTMHVAAAQGVPTIGLFGPNTPVRFAPYGPANGSVYKPRYKKPCINVHLGQIDCDHQDHMTNIQPADVLTALRRIA